MDYKKLADLLFPDVKHTVEYYIKKYPPRKLSHGAEVTRFAPSPTGYMHIGGIYQALVDSEVAHSTGGIFYLRNEDTDSKREKQGAADIIYPALVGFGLRPDEGFVSDTIEIGEYGPYTQSKRVEIYRTFTKHLVEKGFAYPCFCAEENTEARAEQMRLGLPLGYYGRWATCRSLSFSEIERNVKSGRPFTIRIKADGDGNRRFKFVDLRVGDMLLPVNSNDYVILKSDGQALYHLAHLVDDTLMHTTTVIRDESWLPSIPLHIQLFEYAGFPHPKYLHTPTINTIDATTGNVRKVSKRHDDWADSRWFHANGFPWEAVQEYLLNILNSSFEPWREANPQAPISFFKFDTSKMSKSGALFDMVKLRSVSRDVISRMSAVEVYERMLVYTKNYDHDFSKILSKHKDFTIAIYQMDRNLERPRKDITVLSEVKDLYSYMYDETFDGKYDFDEKFDKTIMKNVLERYSKSFNHADTKEEWFERMKGVAEACGFARDTKSFKQNPNVYKGSIADISTIIRVAITGRRQTPDLFAIMKVLGNERVKLRLARAISMLI